MQLCEHDLHTLFSCATILQSVPYLSCLTSCHSAAQVYFAIAPWENDLDGPAPVFRYCNARTRAEESFPNIARGVAPLAGFDQVSPLGWIGELVG